MKTKKNDFIVVSIAIVIGVVFIMFDHFNVLWMVSQFHCGGWFDICAFYYELIGYILIPITFAIFGYVLQKENRIKASLFSLSISLLVMFLSFWLINIWDQIDISKLTIQGNILEQESLKKLDFPPSQLTEDLLPLDNKRAITIVNALTDNIYTNYSTYIIVGSSTPLEAYVRDDAVPSDGIIHTKVIKLNSQDENVDSEGALLSTQQKSPDGRLIFKGKILVKNVFGAVSGYIYIIGKDGVRDGIEVTFK